MWTSVLHYFTEVEHQKRLSLIKKVKILRDVCRISALIDVVLALGTPVNSSRLSTFVRVHRQTKWSAVSFRFNSQGYRYTFLSL